MTSLLPCGKKHNNRKEGQKFSVKLTTSRNGPVKSTETRQGWKRKTVVKKGTSTTLNLLHVTVGEQMYIEYFSCLCFSPLFLSRVYTLFVLLFLPCFYNSTGPSLLVIIFIVNFLPLYSIILYFMPSVCTVFSILFHILNLFIHFN